LKPSASIRLAALLAAPVLAAYANSLSGSFQFDDFNVIVGHPALASLGAWWADLGLGIRPLLKLSYTLNTKLDGGPAGFRAVNLAVHVANTWLVWLLVQCLVRGYGARVAPHAPAAAVVAALLFALHPAQTEAVTYVSGRSASLMATFYLGSVLAYVAGAESGRRVLLRALSPLAFVLALATKESAISLPVVLLLWEASRGGSPGGWRAAARRLAPHAVVLIVAAVALALHPAYGDRLALDPGPAVIGRNLLAQVDAVSHLAARLVAVYPLNIDPDLRAAAAWSPLRAAKAALLVVSIAAGGWALRRRPWAGFGLLWFFAVLAPTNSLLPRADLANDRHLYLACVGVFAALALELELLRARAAAPGRWVRPSLAAVLLVFGALTALRNADYATEVTLWEQTARVSPAKPRVFNNLGFALSAAGRLDEAEAAYREALRLDPGYSLAQDNLERLLERKARGPGADPQRQ
jgi:hypothetical protein